MYLMSYQLEAASRDLAYVQLRVEDRVLRLAKGETLEVVSGDQIEILGATLLDGSDQVLL